MPAHGVHLAVTDVLYKSTSKNNDQLRGTLEEVEADIEEDTEVDLEAEYEEGFVLEENVIDAVLPDMTESYSFMLQKVREVVKFFRNIPYQLDYLLNKHLYVF
jgi:hypothetical protein